MKTAARAGNPGKALAGARVCLAAAEYNLAVEATERRWAAHGYRAKECSVLEAGDCARRAGFGEDATEGVAQLCYTLDAEKCAYPVKLVAVPQARPAHATWHFVCPLAVEGVPCARRVPRLYRPPPALYFGCATCHRVQEGRRRR
jgi:hypothetical protein